jgi:hypothetical protein
VSALALLTLVAAVATAPAPAAPDRLLADRLVARAADLPATWGRPTAAWHPLFGCFLRPRDATARARRTAGSPNSGVWSTATVFAGEAAAERYRRDVAGPLGPCIRRFFGRLHPVGEAGPSPLAFGRFGDRSAAWRIRFWTAETRRSIDIVTVRIGRAVLVEVYLVGYYDERWRDTAGTLRIERRALRRALARA